MDVKSFNCLNSVNIWIEKKSWKIIVSVNYATKPSCRKWSRLYFNTLEKSIRQAEHYKLVKIKATWNKCSKHWIQLITLLGIFNVKTVSCETHTTCNEPMRALTIGMYTFSMKRHVWTVFLKVWIGIWILENRSFQKYTRFIITAFQWQHVQR